MKENYVVTNEGDEIMNSELKIKVESTSLIVPNKIKNECRDSRKAGGGLRRNSKWEPDWLDKVTGSFFSSLRRHLKN